MIIDDPTNGELQVFQQSCFDAPLMFDTGGISVSEVFPIHAKDDEYDVYNFYDDIRIATEEAANQDAVVAPSYKVICISG